MSLSILHTESGLNWGGQEYRTLIETGWLQSHGHRAWIACDPRGELFGRGREKGAPVVGVSMRSNGDWRGFLVLWRFCRRHKIDVINTHGSKDSWLCFPMHLAGFALVRSRHLTVAVKQGFHRSFIYRYGCRRVIGTAQIIRETLVRDNGLNPRRVDVVGEGVNLHEFHPGLDGSSFRAELAISPAVPLIGIIGMIRSEKGHRQFLDAAFEILKTHPEARFVMVGEGTGARTLEKECRARIQQAFGPAREGADAPGAIGRVTGRSCPIIMTGYRSDIPRITAAMDVIVVPSLSEAQSRVVPQAFACRRSVVASRVGGLPELIKDGENGLLVPPGQCGAVAVAVRRLIDDRALRDRLAQAGYETALAHLSLDKMMERTLKVYRRAIDPTTSFAADASPAGTRLNSENHASGSG